MGNLNVKPVRISIGVGRDNTALLRKQLAALVDKEVLVGVPDTTAGRTSAKGTSEPINNAALAYIHNMGSPAMNIPARPTLEPGIEDRKEQISSIMGATGKRVLAGGTVDAGFEAVGLTAVAGVKNRITSNTPPPLAPSTLAARKRRGVSRTNTLVDTGKYLNAQTYVIRKRKGGK